MLTAVFICQANPIEFSHSDPANGETISSWNFTLTFDITKALEDCVGKEVGIGYQGASTACASLYKGDNENGELLGTALTSNFTGKSEGFTVNGNEISFSFDSSISILKDQPYTIIVKNPFYLYNKGKVTRVNSTLLDCSANPIVLHFYGGDLGGEQVRLITSSIQNGDELENLRTVELNFADKILLNSPSSFAITEGDELVASPESVYVSEDQKSIIVDFGKDVYLNYMHFYDFSIPDGTISLLDNPSVSNQAVTYTIKGTKKYVYHMVSSGVDKSETGFIKSAYINFDIPDDKTLITPNGATASMYYGFLYKGNEIEGNCINTLIGKPSEDGKGIIWELSNVMLDPGEQYLIQSNYLTPVYAVGKNRLPECSLAPEIVEFSSPKIDDISFPTITTGTVKIGRHDSSSSPVFVNGGKYASINTIEFAKEDYSYNGESISTTLDWKNLTCYVYDVTGGTRKVVKEMEIGAAQRETNYDYYGVFVIAPQMDFLEGHNYEIVIPKGVIRLNNYPLLYNYVTNDDIVLNLQGATPSEFKIESCSVENNAEMNVLPGAIVWKVYGSYELSSPGATASYRSGEIDSQITSRAECPVTILKEGWNTYVAVQISDLRTGLPKTMRKGWFFTVTLPAGTLVYPGDETLANPELSLTILGADAPVVNPEFVNTKITLADNESNESHSFVVETAKGYPAKIQLLPGENWNVADVAHEGKSLSAVNVVYSSEPLNEDSKIVVSFAYDKEMKFDQSSGVYSVENTDIKVFTENNKIVVAGLTEPTDIAVYTVGGILVKSMRTDAGNDTVAISAEQNQIYVVVINGQAAKIKL